MPLQVDEQESKPKGPPCAVCSKPSDGGEFGGAALCWPHREQWWRDIEAFETEMSELRMKRLVEWTSKWATAKKTRAV